MDPILPNYDRDCVAALVPALLGSADPSWLPEPVSGARAVVLLVLDGLGQFALDRHPTSLATLGSMTGRPISTVVPATTSAALSSITTGAPPAVHGVVGYRTRVDDTVLNVLRWQAEGGGRRAPEPFVVQRCPAFAGRAVPVVAQSEHRNSGFTRAHLGDGPFCGWRTVGTLVEQCRTQIDQGATFVYAYYPGVDEVAHEFGLLDGWFAEELRVADALVARLLEVLPRDVALLVTADHGQVHLDADSWIETMALESLVIAQSGDARFRHLHARPGAQRELAEECRARYADVAWVRTRRQLLDEAWFGPAAEGSVPGRIGDVVLAPFADVGFVDPAMPRERNLRSAHGAPTPDEMWVPLRAARGVGR